MVLLLIIPTQWVWLAVLYTIAGIYTGKTRSLSSKTCFRPISRRWNDVERGDPSRGPGMRPQGPLPQEGIGQFLHPPVQRRHLPGAAAAITMSAMVVTILTKGQTPSLEMFLPFIILLGFIEVAAVGVPGGSVTAALGILESTLGWTSRVWGSWLPCS